ncbi:hypothetical protein GALMADRAFT_65924 [Galerina marginata CBS 339.88]|uniref:Major facilitator superfamily (MFS) profile domain-containing protein n=1 Tax=Galerina marginata (strain CBS 339.88) TaxID=685588 RepID=A0A067TEN9_GALM3|nr:hypothetical protein GALMADRAFT_65924 [Galerina marginata CBS 339.88]
MKNPTTNKEQIPTIPTPGPAGFESRTDTSEATISPGPELAYDIEHVPVKNDPREWSNMRKNGSLVLIAFASMIAALAANIQNPAVEEMEADLPATSSQFSLSISLFILVQGVMPLLWSAISEVKGRKLVYVVSIALFTLGSIIVALSHRIGPVIGFRVLQALGSSAVMAIGAASLADIFDPEERGRKMGIYYVAPLLGPALGPIFGGVLTSVWGWRAIFWFLTIDSGLVLVAFVVFFQDTFRRERSLTYQKVLKRRLRSAALQAVPTVKNCSVMENSGHESKAKTDVDLEKNNPRNASESEVAAMPVITLSITDVNPFKPLVAVLRRKNNFLVLVSSGLLFSFAFILPYATARTLGKFYRYSPLKIGLVTLSYGIGCVFGSILGGRRSDYELARLKEANGGQSYPEMRLKTTMIGICCFPPCVLIYGWLCQQTVHVSVICIFLFLSGFFSTWIYSITLAYIVDANTGMSSTAVAANSAFRGMAAFIGTEIAVPLQDGLGDGWLYTIWAGLMALTCAFMLLICRKGEQWRNQAELRERAHETRSAMTPSSTIPPTNSL